MIKKRNKMSFCNTTNSKGLIFSIFAVLSLLLVVIYKYVLFYHGIHLKYTWVTDLFFFIFTSLCLILKSDYKLVLIVLTLLILKAIGSCFVIDFYESSLEYSKEVFKTIFSFTFVFFAYSYLKTCNKFEIVYVFKIFKYVTLFINFTIIFGAIFSLSLFRTYIGKRFGFSGILFPQSFSSYYIIISILIYFYYNKNIEKISPFFIFIMCLSGFFIGTKAVYFFLFVFLLMFFWINKLYSKVKIMIPSIIIIIIMGLNYNVLKSFIFKVFSALYNLYLKNDLVTFILSYRNFNFNKAKEYISSNWSSVNYLIGGVNRKKMLVEMELFDIYLSLGFLGSILFYYYYYKLIIKPISFEKITVVLFGTLLVIIILSGNFLKSLTLSYFVAFLFVIMIYKPNEL